MTLQNLIKYALPGLILVSFLLGFLPILQKLQIRWNLGDNSYAYLIVPLFLYLCWEKKEDYRFDKFSWSLWGVFLVGLSILLMVVGELGSMETLLFAGLWGCAVAVMVAIYGRRLRHLWFPLLILFFIVPLPPFVNRMLTFNLKLAASSLSVAMLRIAGISVLQDGNIIDLGITQLQVVNACSGLRYLMPLILMALLFGYFYCKQWWQNTLLLITVIPLSIIVNGMRIFVTGMLHVWGKPELAEDFFHDFSGWLVFMLAGAILFGISLFLRRLSNSSRETVEQEFKPETVTRNSKTVYDPNGPIPCIRTVTIVVIFCLLFVGSGYALQHLPSAANLPERNSFEKFPMIIGNWEAKRDYLSQEILDNLWSDDYFSATYLDKTHHNAIHLLIPFYEYQGTRHTAHAPQSCMLGGGWALINSKERFVDTLDGIRFPIMTSTWEKGDTRILAGYFFFQRGRTITSPWTNKYWLVVDAFTRQRTDGALVRAEMTLLPNQSFENAYQVLEGFFGKVYTILPNYVPL